jgi:membrane-associated phospholipid phosphatase
VAAALGVVFLALGSAARDGRVFGWDAAVLRVFHRHEEAAHGSFHDRLANLTVELGGNLATLLLGLLILAVVLSLGRLRDALFLVLTGLVILTVTPLLKEHFERAVLKYSFPSGHAARSSAIVTAAILIAWPTRLRWPTLAVGVLFTAALGLALVYEDWHLPSDVLGGWCLGVACATLTWLATSAGRRGR